MGGLIKIPFGGGEWRVDGGGWGGGERARERRNEARAVKAIESRPAAFSAPFSLRIYWLT